MSIENYSPTGDGDEEWLQQLSARHRVKINQRLNKEKKRPRSQPADDALASLADENDLLSGFEPTYTRNMDEHHHERRWLLEALAGFYRDQMITDVLHIVKGGKEANVYCCEANPQTGVSHIAAKIYRPRVLRHLKNDAIYKEGRFVRDQEGKQVKGGRSARAMRKKTAFGQKLDFATWIVHEYDMIRKLFEAGVDVPRPLAQGVHTILMAFIGEPYNPARTLSDTSIAAAEAQPLFERLMGNVRQMLSMNLIHGDLSAYNVLYWEGDISIIDFPQVVDARHNPSAFMLFERDVVRICQYFEPYGIDVDGRTLAAEMFQLYLDARL